MNLVTLTLDRVVAESWLHCLKYYELDNLSPEDEKQMLESLEQALKSMSEQEFNEDRWQHSDLIAELRKAAE